MVLFCQLDVTGRTESRPGRRDAGAQPPPLRLGLEADHPGARPSTPAIRPARAYLESVGVSVRPYDGKPLSPDEVLVVGPGGGRGSREAAPRIADWLKAGGTCWRSDWITDDAPVAALRGHDEKGRAHLVLLRAVGPQLASRRDRPGGRPQPRPPRVAARHGGSGHRRRRRPGHGHAAVVFFQLPPWQFDGATSPTSSGPIAAPPSSSPASLANMGVAGSTPLSSGSPTP